MAIDRTWVLSDGSLEAISPISQIVRALAEVELGSEAAGDIELALVEAVTNIIRHGSDSDVGMIRIEVSVATDSVDLRIFDWGQPIPSASLAQAGGSRFDFDPADLEALPEGGMGLMIISSVMDEVTYNSDEGQNLLTLRRRVRPLFFARL